MLNLAVILEDTARNFPNHPAFTFGETVLNYAQINGAANQVAHGLRAAGLQPGDKVALSCLNLPYFPILYYGILKAGCVVVPLSVLLKTDEIAYHLQDSDAKAYFCFEGTAELPMGAMGQAGFHQAEQCEHFFLIMPQLDQPASIEGAQTLGQLMQDQPGTFESHASAAEDTCVIVYTSGTTGQPKGAELSHNNLLQNAILSADLFQTQTEDRQLIVLPLFHIFAMTTLMNAGVYRGASNILLPRFEAEAVFGLMQKHAITIFAGVPTMYWGLLQYQGDAFDLKAIASHLKVAVSGGASLPIKVLEDFQQRFDVAILEGYGMSEGAPVVTFNQPRKQGCKPGSIGTPVWGVEVKLVDDQHQPVAQGEKGELLFRGHNVMNSYYKRPDQSAEALQGGWMHSGDVAMQDEDGFYFIVDRTKDMIIRGGLNVYPREVEDVMMQHPAVSLVAVVGEPDAEKGEEIKACVVLKPEHTISEAELIAWTRDRIAAYKYPRRVVFLEALPMSATGKILKKELRQTSDSP